MDSEDTMVGRLYVLDKNGNPAQAKSIEQWAKWFHTCDRCVAKDEIGNVCVSTVFLGINHSLLQNEAPLLYETMIFNGEHDGYQMRYSTHEDALAGHKIALDLAKNKVRASSILSAITNTYARYGDDEYSRIKANAFLSHCSDEPNLSPDQLIDRGVIKRAAFSMLDNDSEEFFWKNLDGKAEGQGQGGRE